MSDVDQHKVSLTEFDENDPRQHQMKCLFSLSSYFGFRGGEPGRVLVTDIEQGTFEESHPFGGQPYALVVINVDKTRKLSGTQPHVRDVRKSQRLPLLDFFDPTSACPASTLVRLAEKAVQGSKKLFCQVKGYGAEAKFTARPLGKAGITKLYKEGAKILGITCPKDFCPQALRAMFITNLANNPGVSETERMEASRHSSVAASAIYIETGAVSESHRFQALGYPVPKIDVTPVYPLLTTNQKAVDFDDVRKPAAKKLKKNPEPVSFHLQYFFYVFFNYLPKIRFCVASSSTSTE